MKKLFRKVWLGILAIATICTGACCTNKPVSDGDDSNQVNNETSKKPSKSELRKRIAAIRETVAKREMSCVYGSPEVIQNYGRETQRLRAEADSLQYILDHYHELK